MRKSKKNKNTNPDPYEDMIKLEKLDPYEGQIKANFILRKNIKSKA